MAKKQSGGKKPKSRKRVQAEAELSAAAATAAIADLRPHVKKTRENLEKFLLAVAEGYSVTEACALINTSRDAIYRWREEDPDFKTAWDKALEMGTNALEDCAQRRARSQSDALLIFLLKARNPARFRDGPRGGSVQFPGDGQPGDSKGAPVRFTFDFGSGVTPNQEDE